MIDLGLIHLQHEALDYVVEDNGKVLQLDYGARDGGCIRSAPAEKLNGTLGGYCTRHSCRGTR